MKDDSYNRERFVTELSSIEDRIAARYSDLSGQLRKAADYVAANPMDVASRSLRAVSSGSGLSPATYSRLARALGFDTYEDMRELCREAVGQHVPSFSEKAERLGDDGGTGKTVFQRQTEACIANIATLQAQVAEDKLIRAVEVLARARNVVLFGAFGSTGIVEYLAYLANYCTSNWTLAGRMGASLGSALSVMNDQDVLFIVTKSPYARRAIIAAQMAQDLGATTIIITDSHSCPALKYADVPFIVPSESPQFFSSYTATLALLESLMAMLVACDPKGTSLRIRDVETRNSGLGEFWSE